MKQDLQNENAGVVTIKNGEQVVRKYRKHRKKKKLPTAAKVIIAIIAVIGILVLGGFLFLFHGEASVKAPAENTSDLPVKQTIDYAGQSYSLNEDVVTILFIGHDNDADTSNGVKANEADAVMALALDTSSGKMTAIGIPRDTMCLVDQYVQGEFAGTVREQLCLAYGYGDTSEHASENVVKSARSIMCNIPIKYYYTIDEAAVAELNDAIGGVSLVPLQTIPRTNIVEGQETVLLGKSAHDYVQYRNTSDINSSKDRLARETQYIKAFVDQAFDSPNGAAKKMTSLLSIISDYSTTNISASEMTYLTNTMAPSISDGIDVVTLEGTMSQNGHYVEMNLDENSLYKVILDTYYEKA